VVVVDLQGAGTVIPANQGFEGSGDRDRERSRRRGWFVDLTSFWEVEMEKEKKARKGRRLRGFLVIMLMGAFSCLYFSWDYSQMSRVSGRGRFRSFFQKTTGDSCRVGMTGAGSTNSGDSISCPGHLFFFAGGG